MPAKTAAAPTTVSQKLAELRKKDKDLRVGSLSSFDMNSRDSLSTGNISLDNATGVGGFPRGRVIELYGPSQSGKTTSALKAAALHQARVKAGEDTGAVMFLDYERSLDETYCKALGLDTDDEETFIYFQPESFEEGANFFREFLNDGLLAICIADSVAAMVSEKELNAATGSATVADRAKALHQFMRQITGPLAKHRCTLIMLNHVMDLIDLSFMGQKLAAQGVKRTTTPGGTALPFYSSMRVEFKQVKTHKGTVFNPVTQEDEELQTATTVEAKIVKNKVSRPQRVAKMRVRYGKGFSQEYSVYQVLVAYKKIKIAGSWITVPEDLSPFDDGAWKVQGEETVIKALEADANWMKRMEALAQQLVNNYTPDQDTDDFDIDPNINPDTGEIKDDE